MTSQINFRGSAEGTIILGVRWHAPGEILQNHIWNNAFFCILEASFSMMLLRDLLAGETENWTFVVWGSWNKPICVLRCYKFWTCIAYRRRILKFLGSNLTPAESFFCCSLLPVLSYLTATCEAIFSVKEWNRKMKIKPWKRTVVIKKLRSVYISDQKTKSVYFKLRPLPRLSYAPAEYCLYIFYF